MRWQRDAELALLLALWWAPQSNRVLGRVERVSTVRLHGKGVEKRFGRVAALRGIDFELEPGESVAILGANGAGKSTLLRILAGLSHASAGRFEAARTSGPAPSNASEASSTLSRDALRGEVGYVGHATLLYGELTARENLLFAARLHGRQPTRAALDGLLAEFGLEAVAERRAGTFSRGMAQRLSIARAVIHEPSVLLLDEPFTGLDESSAARLSSQLSHLRLGGRTLILVTHDPRRALELCERALVLHRGEIRATPARGDGASFELTALRETLTRLAGDGAIGSAA
jgi:ABC-type multidrug transport system ATPase subunit